MRRVVAFIPNLLTLCNLVAGCAAIIYALHGVLVNAFWAVILAAVFDFLDGFAARLLKATSPIGKELDSLADMVSFGAAPSFVVYAMLPGAYGFFTLVAFLIAAFSALRLAKFNIDDRQTEEFRGLPTPACALFFLGLYFQPLFNPVEHPWILLGLVALFSGLLVCDMRMFSLKFKSYGWSGNQIRYIFLLCVIALIVVWNKGGVSPAIALYILICSTQAIGREIGRKSAEKTDL